MCVRDVDWGEGPWVDGQITITINTPIDTVYLAYTDAAGPWVQGCDTPGYPPYGFPGWTHTGNCA